MFTVFAIIEMKLFLRRKELYHSLVNCYSLTEVPNCAKSELRGRIVTILATLALLACKSPRLSYSSLDSSSTLVIFTQQFSIWRL
jgi:hypothetical protein